MITDHDLTTRAGRLRYAAAVLEHDVPPRVESLEPTSSLLRRLAALSEAEDRRATKLTGELAEALWVATGSDVAWQDLPPTIGSSYFETARTLIAQGWTRYAPTGRKGEQGDD